jgi:chromosome condensin MukBEF MukE localization factor
VLAAPPPRLGQAGISVSDQQFGETKYTPDSAQFLHAVADKQYYREVDKERVNELIQSVPPRNRRIRRLSWPASMGQREKKPEY